MDLNRGSNKEGISTNLYSLLCHRSKSTVYLVTVLVIHEVGFKVMEDKGLRRVLALAPWLLSN